MASLPVGANRVLFAALFAVVFGLEFAFGFYYAYMLDYTHSDAMSRVANAFYVLYSRDPHLAAIGFVWNPLPSLMQLPLLLAYPLFPELASFGLAGIVMSSSFAAGTAVLLASEGLHYRLGRLASLLLALLYSLNPFVFLFGSNGLSDAPFNFFTMCTVMAFARWLHDEKSSSLVVAGMTLSMAFWTRYEAVPFGAALFAAILATTLLIHRRSALKPLEQRNWAYQRARGEATLVLLMTPVIYSGLLWIMWNYVIMDNPLYFLNSEYSNMAQSGMLMEDEDYVRILSSPWLSLVLVLKKTAFFAIPLGAIMIIRLLSDRLFRWDMLILILMFISIPTLQYLLLLRGSTFAWFRYFMYGFPITVAWLPYELSQVKGKKTAWTILSLSLLASAVLLTYAMLREDIAPDEYGYITMTGQFDDQRLVGEIARYMNEQLSDAVVMMDSSTSFRIILKSIHPERYVITSDRIFHAALDDPQSYGIEYILTLNPTLATSGSAIHSKYPGLYEDGARWLELYKEFGPNDWRLYKVTGEVYNPLRE